MRTWSIRPIIGHADARAVIAFDLDGIPAAGIAGAPDITQRRVRDPRGKDRPGQAAQDRAAACSVLSPDQA